MVPTHYLSENKHAGRWYIKIWDFCCLSITQSPGVLNFFVVVVGNSVDFVTALKKHSFVVYLVVSCLSFPLSGVRSDKQFRGSRNSYLLLSCRLFLSGWRVLSFRILQPCDIPGGSRTHFRGSRCSYLLFCVAYFYREGKCFLLIMFSLLTLAKRVERGSEVPVTHTLYFLIAQLSRDGQCFLLTFFSLLIFAKGLDNSSEVPVTHTFSIPVANFIAMTSVFS